jgi:integrase
MKNSHPWIERYRDHLVASGRFEPTTVLDRCELLYRLDAELPLGLLEATVEELEHWMASGRTPERSGRPSVPWSRQTRATYYAHAVGFYRFAADPRRNPHLSYDPSTSLSRPKVPEGVPNPCTNDELAAILDRTRGRYRIYCRLSAYGGLRAIQICNLMREDITEENLFVAGKGGKTIAIPTHPMVWDAVHDFPRGPIAMAGSAPGRAASAPQVRAKPGPLATATGREIRRILGYPGISLRNLRHWFATTLLLEEEFGGSGANLRTVQELMGHSSPSTTAVYTKVVGKQRKMAISALPPLAPTSI